MDEIHFVFTLRKNDKSSGLDGIPMEVYRALFDVLVLDLLRVVHDSQKCGKILVVFNSTLISLIPNIDIPKYFDDFSPISLCNFIYDIIGKIISMHITKVLGRYISGEQFGFLPGRQIHDVVGVISKGIHTICRKILKSLVLKIDLSKFYDMVIGLFLG